MAIHSIAVVPMRQHPRLPAAAILAAFALLGGLYLAGPALGRALARAKRGNAPAVEDGATGASAAAAFALGETLRKKGDCAGAAAAYARTLEKEPYHREAVFQRAWCLAAAGDREAFYEVMRDLVVSDAKLSVDLFDTPVAKAWLSEPRFAALVQEARAQAMD